MAEPVEAGGRSPRGQLGLSLEQFLEGVGSRELLPGGGYVAGIAVAMAAGLVEMAARLSRGEWPEAPGAGAQAEALRVRATALAEQNAEVYIGAVGMLRSVDGDPGSRDDAIAEALERAAEIPLRIGETAADVSALAATVAERGEASVRADVAVAALLAQAGARAAGALVAVNLGAVPNDDRLTLARELSGAATAALERTLESIG